MEQKEYIYKMSYDPRFIANLILDISGQAGVRLTNGEVNKIAYFMHAWYLAQYDRPLIGAKIEAWEYGPVIREIYSEFKRFGADPITARAKKIDVDKLERVVVTEPISSDDFEFVANQVRRYMGFGLGKLVGLSHVRGGPWDQVYNSEGRSNPGMEISNELIRDYFASQTRH